METAVETDAIPQLAIPQTGMTTFKYKNMYPMGNLPMMFR